MNNAHQKNNFHLLRFIGAVFVIMTHSYALNGKLEQDPLWHLTNRAFTFSYIGIVFFFVISGYLITASADTKEENSIKAALRFIWKRILRILPAFFVVVLASVFVLGPLFTSLPLLTYFRSEFTWGYLQTLTIFKINYSLPGVFENNPLRTINGSLWTIPYEVLCYAGVLILSFIGLPKVKFFLLILYVLAAIKASSMPIHTSSTSLILFNIDVFSLIRFGMYFVGGALLYLYRDIVKQDGRLFAACFIVLCIGLFFRAHLLISFATLPYLIIYLARVPSRLSSFATYGDFSYGMYLYAFPVQQVIVHVLGKTSVPLLFFSSVILTFPFAYLSWRFIEKPALSFKSIRLPR